MTQHGLWGNPQAHRELGERVLDGKDGGLRDDGVTQTVLRFRGTAAGGIEQITDIDIQVRAEDVGAEIALLAEHGLGLINFASHIRMLRALTGKQEMDGRIFRGLGLRLYAPAVVLRDGGDGIRNISRDNDSTIWEE